MDIYRTKTLGESLPIFQRLFNKGPGLIINVCEEPFVATGPFNTYDPEACEELGLPVWKTVYPAGTAVVFPGDLSFCELYWGLSDFAPRTMAKLLQMIGSSKYQLTPGYENNDLLVNNQKVASWARANTREGWCLSVVHCSVNLDPAVINKVCTKQPSHPPGQLSKWGITALDMLKELGLEEGSV